MIFHDTENFSEFMQIILIEHQLHFSSSNKNCRQSVSYKDDTTIAVMDVKFYLHYK